MACPYYPYCSCGHCSSDVSTRFPESPLQLNPPEQSVSIPAIADQLQGPQTMSSVAVQQQYTQHTLFGSFALQSGPEGIPNYIYHEDEVSSLDEHSFRQQDPPNNQYGDSDYLPHQGNSSLLDLPHHGNSPLLDCRVALHVFNTSQPDFQTMEYIPVEPHLNPEALSFTPSCVSVLNPDATAFVPSTSSRKGLNPEAAAYLPAGTVWMNGWVYVPQEDFDEEALFFAASQMSPDECARAPLLWPFAFHHLNYFGQQIDGKSHTTPAATLAILKSRNKYEAAKYSENLRISVLHARASLWLDPLVFVGNFEAIWSLVGTQLQDSATGACYKLYHPSGEWKADEWDEDDDYPVLDPEDPDKYTAGQIIINGRFDESFFNRGEDIAELNYEHEQFKSIQWEKRMNRLAGQAAPKSRLRICTAVDDLNQEVECFQTRFDALNPPLPSRWADLSDDEDDELCEATADSQSLRCLPGQGADLILAEDYEDEVDQSPPRKCLFTTKTRLETIPEEDEEEDQQQETLPGQPASLSAALAPRDPHDEAKAAVANDPLRTAKIAIHNVADENERDIIGTPINTNFTLRKKPHPQQASLRVVFNEINTTGLLPGASTTVARPKRVRFSFPLVTVTYNPSPPASPAFLLSSSFSLTAAFTYGPRRTTRLIDSAASASTARDSSEHLAPTPALPTFTRVRPSWYLRHSGWTNFGLTTPSDPIDPNLSRVVAQGVLSVPRRRQASPSRWMKTGRKLWGKVKGLVATNATD
jgi:hypothetical protein